MFKNINHSITTTWLSERNNIDNYFDIPKGIQFLISIDTEARSFYPLDINNRIAAYFWWNKILNNNSSSYYINWKLNKQEVDYISRVTAYEWKTELKNALHQYLQFTEETVPTIDDSLTYIFESESFPLSVYPINITFPGEFQYLLSCRSDLRLAFDPEKLSGFYAMIEWWEKDGQKLYKKLGVDTSSLIDKLNKNIIQDNGLMIASFVFLLLEERSDINDAFDLTTLSGLCGLIDWWEIHGHIHYPRLQWDIKCTMLSLNKMISINDKVTVPLFLKLILSDREDLSKLYDITTIAGLDGFLGWWHNYGVVQYPQFIFDSKLITSNMNKLDSASSGLKLPLFLVKLSQELPELRGGFDVEDQFDILQLLGWWQLVGHNKFQFIDFKLNFSEVGMFNITEVNDIFIPSFIAVIIRNRMDLQSAFETNGLLDRQGLINWWNNHGRLEYSYLSCFYLNAIDNDCVNVSYKANENNYGVNIIGFPQGALGLGEDARLAGQVIESLDVEGVYINAPIPGPKKTVSPDGVLLFSETTKYNISLFCLPPTEMIRLAIEGGEDLITGYEYKIGAWPWELPHWPANFSRVRDLVDEIWAQSEYVKNCFLKDGSTPVYKMPMAVTIPKPTSNFRIKLGIPEDSFVYYLMFDGNSWLSRKNPLSGVLAFQQAFSISNDYRNVRLLIKAMNINPSDTMWQRIVNISKSDPRIIIITDMMDRLSLINLMSSCDCYISLHRSEGFGRVIAEAMLLGQPVVATNFSGNVDFCNTETSFLVDGDLVPLQQGDYIFYEGQYWCDPDIDLASKQLRVVYEDTSLRERVSKSGQTFINHNYSVSAVAKFYSERLQEIKKPHAQ
ncbi:glycosyltransferase family 4 protein [Rahnella aceris]|uniref:glycosyltransferase family 4 protein n=1 Tax=Rahnella sp. (strain Y9602) TaxID=2703885 RepID=UPI0019035686|nr:glycosyltransferase family 4 protein [Rahnella aceris]QQN35635.1 glycosyltransferase family 4 protein [Rahnella aceris]